jgi:uncharacterized repeat protein (TIGR03803 family)
MVALLRAPAAAVLLLIVLLFSAGARAGGAEQVIYSFNEASGPAAPAAGPIVDKSGNLYFPTVDWNYGGVDYPGSVVELSQSDGQWTATTLWAYGTNQTDGQYPNGLLLRDGVLYGTTFEGGSTDCPLQFGCGTVYELVQSSTCGNPAGWCEIQLYYFQGGSDGMQPQGPLIMDGRGNLFGTTVAGGEGCNDGCGTVFEMEKNASGYKEKILYRFPPRSGTFVGKNGSGSITPLLLASDGSLLGTAQAGGAHGFGTVFQLTPNGHRWDFKVLHTFDGKDGAFPDSGLVANGGFYYGVTAGDQTDNYGTVYGLTPGTPWKFTRLYAIPIKSDTGSIAGPIGDVVFDTKVAQLFFVTNGYQQAPGAIFSIDSSNAVSVVHDFTQGNADDAEVPYGPLVLFRGQLYGVGADGGAAAAGAVFSLSP